ncbi:ferredoxin [Zoogloea sp. LCSB751]|uniref:ferredoxin n=1 Tax=Zoogloea sp. LCSB751 TaxID=1965277 RepID=UPI0009A51D9A|nr:ferredoxin [Zoogloea sp. LCSB751]
MNNPENTGKALHRVFAERSKCCGYGLCAAICPEVYKLDADGLVYLESEFVPAGLEESASEGAVACPAEALRVEAPTGT